MTEVEDHTVRCMLVCKSAANCTMLVVERATMCTADVAVKQTAALAARLATAKSHDRSRR